MSEAELEAQALALINQGREALGLPLLAKVPRANRSEHHACVTFSAFQDAGVTFAGGDGLNFDDPIAVEKLGKVWGTDYSTVGTPIVKLPPTLQEINMGEPRKRFEYNTDRWAFLHQGNQSKPGKLVFKE